MADPNFFPGFEGDDEPKKAKPVAPAKAAAPAKPAFDPFAGVPVKVNAPGEVVPAAPAKPATGRVGTAPAAPTPTPAAQDADDSELKPGSRKDLWKCPHCGTGNKPDRTSCRSCGKSPDEAVVVPWFKNNVLRAGILAVICVVILLAVWLSRVDASLHEPGPAGIDQQRPRISGKAEGTIEVSDGISFISTQRLSVSGRVVAVRQSLGMTWVALALGRNARDDNAFKAQIAKPQGAGFAFDGGCLLACVFDGKPELKPGAWLSLVGSTGDLVKGPSRLREAQGAIAVRVEEFKLLEE